MGEVALKRNPAKMVSFWLKLIVMVIDLVCCIIANVKPHGDVSRKGGAASYYDGDNAALFVSARSLFIMVCAGYTLILFIILIAYLFDDFLEVEDELFTLTGFFVFLGAGAVGVYYATEEGGGHSQSDIGLAVGVMLLVSAVLLLTDFILICTGKGGCK